MHKNRILFEDYKDGEREYRADHDELDGTDMLDFVRPEPNRKYKLFLFNRVDSTRYKKQTTKRKKKYAKKNEKRAAKEEGINKKRIEKAKNKGKDRYKHKTIEPKDVKLGFRNTIRNNMGEAPVLLDTFRIRKSREQLEIYLKKHGFYNGHVQDTIIYNQKKRKAIVEYRVHAGAPYVIKEIRFDTVGTHEVAELINMYDRYREKETTLLHVGDVLDENKLDEERTRYSAFCRDQGAYFGFNKNYVNFRVDTTLGNGDVSVELYIRDRMIPSPDNPDSLIRIPHMKYKVKDVLFRLHNPDTISFKDFAAFKRRCDLMGLPYETQGKYTLLDTIDLGTRGLYLFNEKPFVKPDLIDFQNFLESRNWYKDYYVERTYRTMNKLDIFSSITPQIEVDPENPTGRFVNVTYDLVPAKKQSFLLEPRAANTNGILGISGTVSYTNKNLWRGAQRLKIALTGGLEAQPAIVAVADSIQQEKTALERAQDVINTFEFGPVVNITFPKLVPLPDAWTKKMSKRLYPSTDIFTTVNLQKRAEFSRRLAEFSHTWSFKETKTKVWKINLLNFKYVILDKQPFFEQSLQTISDPGLLNSYSDHFSTQIGGSFHYNNLNSDFRKKDNIHDVKIGIVSSGGLVDLYGIGKNAIDSIAGPGGDSLGVRTFLGVPYTQFLKGDIQYIYNHALRNGNKLVSRFVAGIGYAYKNSVSLPYEQSFFAGGSNDHRAFVAKSMAPGGTRKYENDSLTQTQIGDIKIGMNLEYRFNMTESIEGAFFTDIGNIWMLKNKWSEDGDPAIFRWSSFYKQMAVGAGFGVRLDLDFLIIRADVASALYNPYLPAGERWFLQEKPQFWSYYDSYVNKNGTTIYYQDDNESGAYEKAKDRPYSRPHFPKLTIGIGYPF